MNTLYHLQVRLKHGGVIWIDEDFNESPATKPPTGKPMDLRMVTNVINECEHMTGNESYLIVPVKG